MASDSTGVPYPSLSSGPRKLSDPVLRNAIRYTLSEKEYDAVHRFMATRTPRAIRRRTLPPQSYPKSVPPQDDYNAAAVRASLRVFVVTQLGLKTWDIISKRILSKDRRSTYVPNASSNFRDIIDMSRRQPKPAYLKSSAFRLSLSASAILLLHRLLYRFFLRLRSNLLSKDAAPFRRRNPRIARSLTSRVAPAIGASLAGFTLGVCPTDQLRVTIAIYMVTRSLEFLYNALETEGWFKERPWWWGSWMLMPLATGQLLHAFVFDRDCFPKVSQPPSPLRAYQIKPAQRDLTGDIGIWRFHTRPHAKLRSATPGHLPFRPALAQHKRDRRQPRRNVPAQLADLRLPDPLPP